MSGTWVLCHYKKNDVVKAKGEDVVHSIEMLASSCQLQDLYCGEPGGHLCKCKVKSLTIKSIYNKLLHNDSLNQLNFLFM